MTDEQIEQDQEQVLRLLGEYLTSLPGLTTEELLEELRRDGVNLDGRALRILLIERTDLFEARRRQWHRRTGPPPERPVPAPASPAPPSGGRSPAPSMRRRLDRHVKPGQLLPGPGNLERELRDRLVGRRLVAEAQIDARLHEQVEDALTEIGVVGKDPLSVALAYPALLVSYLVGHGTYRWSNAFWTNQTLPGVDHLWGPAFEQAIRSLDLETFEDMVFGDGALRYVGPILAHGGVPKYSLEDYFKLIHRWLDRAENGVDLLSLWRTRRTAFQNIDRPVRRFLLYGGDLAVDLVDRTLDLFREFSRSGTVPKPASAGL